MNNPFEYTPDPACREAFADLCAQIEALRSSTSPEDINFIRELDNGKMLGILIASDPEGNIHTLHAFSGQLGNTGFLYRNFAEPVFNYLDPRGHFKTTEADISRQNRIIAEFEHSTLSPLRLKYSQIQADNQAQIEALQKQNLAARGRRQERRQTGVSPEEQALMIRQSQFEKAELARLKKKLKTDSDPLLQELKQAENHLAALKQKRHSDSESLQNWLFSNFKFLNARGEEESLSNIFEQTATRIPPSGAGECCAPKLLQAAFRNGWTPISIAEFWYGAPKEGELRIHGQHYPACRGKCLPILSWMLQGLEVTPPLRSHDRSVPTFGEPSIIFENEWFCVVNKPAGMLSVPGKGSAISAEEWLKKKYGKEKNVKMAHRLDQDTSGLLVATFTDSAFREMQKLFASRQVDKTYIAILDGDYRQSGLPSKGRITLPLAPDLLDRPRQLVDPVNGKEAVTDFEFLPVENNHTPSSAGLRSLLDSSPSLLDSSAGLRSRILFHPHTGRTHQLRVTAASPLGLNLPILGDPLYSTSPNAGRLHLHALSLSFSFPLDRQSYHFSAPSPF